MSSERESIIEYGDIKYYLGYKDGYAAGIISGVLLASICIVATAFVRRGA